MGSRSPNRLKYPGAKRLMLEAKELQDNTEDYWAQPIEDNLFEWHFTVRGPPDTAFDGGFYHGRISFPTDYPMKPPSIIMLTPNGRFVTNRKICLSISGHHPETWQPSWSVRTALLAIIGFMPSNGQGAIGSLNLSDDERRMLARRSRMWRCDKCGPIKDLLKTPSSQSSTNNVKKTNLESSNHPESGIKSENQQNCINNHDQEVITEANPTEARLGRSPGHSNHDSKAQRVSNGNSYSSNCSVLKESSDQGSLYNLNQPNTASMNSEVKQQPNENVQHLLLRNESDQRLNETRRASTEAKNDIKQQSDHMPAEETSNQCLLRSTKAPKQASNSSSNCRQRVDSPKATHADPFVNSENFARATKQEQQQVQANRPSDGFSQISGPLIYAIAAVLVCLLLRRLYLSLAA